MNKKISKVVFFLFLNISFLFSVSKAEFFTDNPIAADSSVSAQAVVLLSGKFTGVHIGKGWYLTAHHSSRANAIEARIITGTFKGAKLALRRFVCNQQIDTCLYYRRYALPNDLTQPGFSIVAKKIALKGKILRFVGFPHLGQMYVTGKPQTDVYGGNGQVLTDEPRSLLGYSNELPNTLSWGAGGSNSPVFSLDKPLRMVLFQNVYSKDATSTSEEEIEYFKRNNSTYAANYGIEAYKIAQWLISDPATKDFFREDEAKGELFALKSHNSEANLPSFVEDPKNKGVVLPNPKLSTDMMLFMVYRFEDFFTMSGRIRDENDFDEELMFILYLAEIDGSPKHLRDVLGDWIKGTKRCPYHLDALLRQYILCLGSRIENHDGLACIRNLPKFQCERED